MTFQEYINNPTGAKSAVLSYRKMYEDLYHNKWNKLMVRENGKIDYTLYCEKNNYYCHIKIPSEVVENFYYDVVIKLVSKDKSNRNLNDAEVYFFSNDPSFNFTFAYAFRKHKLHVPELEKKMSSEALNNKPKEKNPDNSIGYVKSLYFAFIAMKEKGLFYKIKYESEGKVFNQKILLSNIKDTNTCIEERVKLTPKKEKKIQPKENTMVDPEVRNGGYTVRTISRTGTGVKRVGSVGSIGKVNTIKKTSKSRR